MVDLILVGTVSGNTFRFKTDTARGSTNGSLTLSGRPDKAISEIRQICRIAGTDGVEIHTLPTWREDTVADAQWYVYERRGI